MIIINIIVLLSYLTKEVSSLQGDYKNISAQLFLRNETVPYIFQETLNKHFDHGYELRKKDRNLPKMVDGGKMCQYIFIVDFNVSPPNNENSQSTFIYWNTKYNNVTIKDNKNTLYLEDQNIHHDNTFENVVKNSLIFSDANEKCTITFEFSLNYLYRKKMILKTGYIIFLLLIMLIPITIVIFK
uniref:Uncharacterized protein n=2 Tax=Strongyloides stercoralis TaxID=6248 RepID=A0AAF5DGP5_STRER